MSLSADEAMRLRPPPPGKFWDVDDPDFWDKVLIPLEEWEAMKKAGAVPSSTDQDKHSG